MKYTTFLLCILLGGCCTKKDCDNVEEPRINLRVSKDGSKGFSRDDIRDLKVMIIGKTFNFLDSVQPFPSWDDYYHNSKDATITLDRYFLNQVGHHDIKAFDFNIIIDSVTFKIDRVSYKTQTEEIGCNKCLFADGSATVVRVIELDYYLDNRHYNGINTVSGLER